MTRTGPTRCIAMLCIAAATACSGPGGVNAETAGNQETWRGIEIRDEYRCSRYDADDYWYPQSVELSIIAELGGIYSPYTNEIFEDRYETDIEHMIARSEAHDSGLCRATKATRAAFAQDLLNLTLAAPALNRREKGAKDATDWLPDYNQCWFAERVIAVRRKYRLTIDRAEAGTLDLVLSRC